jgi:tetratricopeptide (TPR) repeat protein
MLNKCPSCGTSALPAARFCRMCGIPLPHLSVDEEQSSPLAVTIRLNGEGRTTDNIDEAQNNLNNTRRVERDELERLLQFSEEIPKQKEPLNDKEQMNKISSASTSHSTTTAHNVELKNGNGREEESYPGLFLEKQKTNEFKIEDYTLAETYSSQHNQPTLNDLRESSSIHSKDANRANGNKRGHLLLYASAASLLFLLVSGSIIGYLYKRSKPSSSAVYINVAPSPVINPDKGIKEREAEIQLALSKGDSNRAIELLGQIIKDSPDNVGAYKELGKLLINSGNRQEAIKTYKQAIQYSAKDAELWQSLALTQFAEGLYEEAVKSYNELFGIPGITINDELTWLGYADALIMAGKVKEAEAIYQRLSSSSSQDIASIAKKHLAMIKEKSTAQIQKIVSKETQKRLILTELPQSVPTPNIGEILSSPSPTPTPEASSPPKEFTPIERYNRGVELWSQNRAAAVIEFQAAKNVPDAHYYLGLVIAEGRDPSSLSRAELVSALLHFQIAQNSRHGTQSRQYADQLGLEYDRRKRQQKP